MKLSIAWIFEHLEASWKDYDIAQLVAQFNTTTAEVEHFYKKDIDLALFSLGQVINLSPEKITVFSPEWQQEFSFERRPAHEGDVFLITKNNWATLRDLQGEKEGLVPALSVLENDLTGAWKETFETEDYILELDNKSITHRPDMWCHRGFAREVAAMFDVRLKPLEQFLSYHEVKKYESQAPSTPNNPYAITLKDKKVKHFAGLYIEQVATEPSLLKMAHRLIKIDSRPINAIVDSTNYVMNDIGQPMHAFDAGTIESKKIEPRAAKKGEKITLLDGQTVTLEPADLIISDGKNPLALAGIMGGKESAITHDTASIFVEAACFDAATIRKTSARLKLRTDSSARFEKSLDPHLNVLALQRFLKILHESDLATKISGSIESVGHEPSAPVIEVDHSFIQARLGETVTPQKIKSILEKLEFGVLESKKNGDVHYTVTVPTFRATKDILIKEDIVEEVGRFVGYASIPLRLPSLAMQPKDLTATRSLRVIKNHCAYALQMHEVNNYAFFDEEFLPKLSWQPSFAVTVKNPVSEHWKRLVTSLMPHLFKNIYQNETQEDRLRFFECGRAWELVGDTVKERKSIAGIFFDRKKAVDFYNAKAELATLFQALELNVTWHKVQDAVSPWYNPLQTAVLMHEKEIVGIAGKAEQVMISRLADGDAFIFELNGDFITSYHAPVTSFNPPAKYPAVWLDISMLVPLTVTVAELITFITNADERITQVELIDFFEKEEWADRRSLTFRYYAQDRTKTLEKNAIDKISHEVTRAVKTLGVTVR